MRYGGAVPIWPVVQGGWLTALGATDDCNWPYGLQPISEKCAIAMMADLPAAHGGSYCRGITGTCRECETGMGPATERVIRIGRLRAGGRDDRARKQNLTERVLKRLPWRATGAEN